jgi:hypothetical protein
MQMTKLDDRNLIMFACDVLRIFDIHPSDFSDNDLILIGIKAERLYQIYSVEAERDAREFANKRQAMADS